jgi:hypothetical protein
MWKINSFLVKVENSDNLESWKKTVIKQKLFNIKAVSVNHSQKIYIYYILMHIKRFLYFGDFDKEIWTVIFIVVNKWNNEWKFIHKNYKPRDLCKICLLNNF